MTDTRKNLAAAIRPFGPGGRIPAAAVPALDALADALGIPKDGAAAQPLGALSERYESGGRGPGTVSSGAGDPGGVSYGTYQLASKTGTAAAFVRNEGARWPELAQHAPGSAGFSAAWRAIAQRQPQDFGAAQHAFIERTHYRPVVDEIKRRVGVDLDAQPQAVRDAVWSVAVQHGKAADILVDALVATDRSATPPADLLRAIYRVRSNYVRGVAARQKSPAQRNTLLSIVENRYPDELARALAMLG